MRSVVSGVVFFYVSVSVIASFTDSERADVTVSIEQSDHTRRKEVRKDVPIIIRDSMPTATVQTFATAPPVGVPTVDVTERGGKKEVVHSYR
jgi:hypothetical protein